MRRHFNKLWLLPLVALFTLASCERPGAGAAGLPTAPSDQFLGGLLGGATAPGYTIVKAPLLSGDLKASNLIGLEGGTVTLLGHTLVVPIGAVSQPTLFTIIQLPTWNVEVDLTATSISSLLGTVLDVGSKGFVKRVTVSLSYAGATNVKDPSKLTVLRVHGLFGYSDYEVMPSRVNAASKTVSTDLEHFSRYVIAYPE